MERREVETWIATNCHPEKGHGWFRVRWRENDKARPVVVTIVLDQTLDVPVVLLHTELFDWTSLDMMSALANNNRLSVGAIALDGEKLVLRHVLPLETLTPPQLERSLRQLAGEASRIRAACIRDPRADFSLFGHFAY
jgi:hypothetical protein